VELKVLQSYEDAIYWIMWFLDAIHNLLQGWFTNELKQATEIICGCICRIFRNLGHACVICEYLSSFFKELRGWMTIQFSGHYHHHLKVMTVNYFVPVVNSRLSSLNIQKCHEILFLVLECNALLYNIFYLSLDRFWEFFVPSCANWLLYNSILNWLWLADIICYI